MNAVERIVPMLAWITGNGTRASRSPDRLTLGVVSECGEPRPARKTGPSDLGAVGATQVTSGTNRSSLEANPFAEGKGWFP
jgi:hypothetical protein